jgi:hypothetical protein
MSSIKRDVKKKILPRPETEKILVSRSSPLPIVATLDSSRGFALTLLALLCGFHFLGVTTPIESET